MNFIKKIITTFFILFTVCVSTACTPSKTVEKLPPTKPASLSGIGYDNFEEGLSAFAKDYDVIKTYLLDMMDYYDISKSLESEKLKKYYSDFVYLLSMIDLEIGSLIDYDSLPSKSYDRAEGELISSKRYGYKIKQNEKLKFGCDDTTTASQYAMSGDISSRNNFFNSQITQYISDSIVCKTKTEVIMDSNDKFILRYVKSIDNGNIQTKAAYIIYENEKVQVAYYDGNADVSQIISFEQLIDYNMNAITFGLGYVLSFSYEIQ